MILAPTKEKTVLGVILDRELRSKLEDAALANERSLGAEVRHLLRLHLDKGERDGAEG